jgi:hypothetical protein
MSDSSRPERTPAPLPAEAVGLAPGRGRLLGRKILVVGAGTRPSPEPNPPIGNGRAISVPCAREAPRSPAPTRMGTRRATLALVEKEGARGTAWSVTSRTPRLCEASPSPPALGGLDGVVLNVGSRARAPRRHQAEDWDLASR